MAAYRKVTFAKLTNKTWEKYRPPKRSPALAGSALFRQIPRVARPQPSAAKSTNKKKQHQQAKGGQQQPARPSSVNQPVTRLAQHKVEQNKNGVNGQNGHSNHVPNNTPNRDGRNNANPGARNSTIFPSSPRYAPPPARREEKPTRPTDNPVRPAQPPVTRQESKPVPTEKPSAATPPLQERNNKPTFPREGSSSGISHDRRSAWLPANGTNRAPANSPPVRPAQPPQEPVNKEEQAQPRDPQNPAPSRDSSPYNSSDRINRAQTEPTVRSIELSQPTPVRSMPETPWTESRPNTPQHAPGPAAPRPQPSMAVSAAALQRVFSRFPDLPAQSALLGLCDDGLPVMLDLFEPTPGAMVVIGDEREAQLEMLRSVIASAAMRNSPRALQFAVLTMQPDAWEKWIAERGFSRHCLGVSSANEESAREWILRLADWTEARRTGRSSGPPVLLIMDTLSFLTRLELDARLNFDWLAKEGPIAAIWPIAAISTDLASSLGSRLAPFNSKVLGCTGDPSLYIRVAGVNPGETAEFRKPGEFAVRVSENWLRFRLPK